MGTRGLRTMRPHWATHWTGRAMAKEIGISRRSVQPRGRHPVPQFRFNPTHACQCVIVTPAEAGDQGVSGRTLPPWIPAFAGMTDQVRNGLISREPFRVGLRGSRLRRLTRNSRASTNPARHSRVRGSSIANVRCWVGCGVVVIKLTPSGASKRCQAPCGTITTIPALSPKDRGPSSVMM